MKILVLFQYWYPYEGALQPIYGAVFEDLVRQGHSISIVTSFPHYRKGREETWDEYRGKLYENSRWKGCRVVRTWVFAPRYKSSRFRLAARALNYLSFSVSSLLACLLIEKHDVLFVPSSPPLLGALVARVVGFFKRTPYIYNLQDAFPGIAVEAGVVREGMFLKLLTGIEKSVYRRARLVAAISDTLTDMVRAKGGKNAAAVTIPNFCDTDFIQPLPRDNEFARRHDLHDRFVLMFAGNIGMVQSVEHIVAAAERLTDTPEILFVFVGRGENREAMQRLSREKNLDNVRFLPLQPYSNMPLVWASADVGLVSLAPGISKLALPSKTFGIMAAGRAVLAMIDTDSEVVEIVARRAQCGVCVPPEDSAGLAAAARQLCGDREATRRMGDAAREYVLRHLHRQVISQKYEAALRWAVSPAGDESFEGLFEKR